MSKQPESGDDLVAFEDESSDDFAEEHTPSPTDPPNAEPDAKGGEDEGHQPPTRA
ncbi:hypothetical protein [Spirillospora sp. NPDC047279]|uniref:hypothetical protein n=1 Tax=Spirillospora sp. NPDC047279 TaxID=3155478 RepID=UPI0033D136BF